LAPVALFDFALLSFRWWLAQGLKQCAPGVERLKVGAVSGHWAGELSRHGTPAPPSCVEATLALALALAMLALAAAYTAVGHVAWSTQDRLVELGSSMGARRATNAVEGATRHLTLGWRQHTAWDGRVFYSHCKSGRVQWTMPAELSHSLRPLDSVPEV